MERIIIPEKDFNKLTKDELMNCFALVTHDGSDQYVSGWKVIIDDCMQEARETKSNAEATKFIAARTNLQLLDKYYEQNSDLNGNNHELLLAKIIKGIPKLYVIQID